MSFVTATFLVFLVVTYTFWRVLPHKPAKVFLCFAGLVFYAWWFPPYVLLLLTSGVIDYVCSLKMRSDARRAKQWLIASILTNLSFLVFFKYTNLFLKTFYILSGHAGLKIDPVYLHLILPLGISFYTFQSLSYTIDVYRKKLEPCKNPFDFFVYLSFFPHLVAGPILRASDFIPQLATRRPLTIGDWHFFVYRISRGFFLKVVIADNIAPQVVKIFSTDPSRLHRVECWYGMLLFSAQIFCDFAGYSDIAIGTARLLGLGIKENFNNPYSARGIGDFWKRWHISLTSWFRDYVYISLGGNRVSKARTYFNIFFIFLISGFWHGASWTFVAWGAIHGLGLLIERRLKETPSIVSLSRFFICRVGYQAFSMLFVMFAWVAFRAGAFGYMTAYWKALLFGAGGFSSGMFSLTALGMLAMFAALTVHEALKERNIIKSSLPRMYIEAMFFFTAILLLQGEPSDFIYFQF